MKVGSMEIYHNYTGKYEEDLLLTCKETCL